MERAHAVALAAVVMLNYTIGHLATSWVMPPNVQSAAQTLIGVGYIGFIGWLTRRAAKANPQNGTGNGGAPSSVEPATRH